MKVAEKDGEAGEQSDVNNEYVNQQGVRFTPQEDSNEGFYSFLLYISMRFSYSISNELEKHILNRTRVEGLMTSLV